MHHSSNLARYVPLLQQGLSCVALAALLSACGGGGDSGTSPDNGAGGGGGVATPVDVSGLSGTYSVKTGSTVVASFMIDKAATVTSCTIGTEASCTAEVTPPSTTGGTAAFKLKGAAGGSTLSGSISAQGAVTAQQTTGSSTQQVIGSKVSDTYADCQSPYTRSGGQCVPPASNIVLRPIVQWKVAITADHGKTYTMQYCNLPNGVDCTDISPDIHVTAEDLADEETPAIIAYAESVATEFQAMLNRMYDAKTYPTRAQATGIFYNAVRDAINNDAPTAVASAGAAFVAAGFPAATGGQSSAPSGTAPTAESECASQTYPGDTSEPQVYLFDKIAQLDACLYKTTNNDKYVEDGDRQCKVLNGLLQATIGTFQPLFCNGPKLKQ